MMMVLPKWYPKNNKNVYRMRNAERRKNKSYRFGIKRMQVKKEEVRLPSSRQDLPKNRLRGPSKHSLQPLLWSQLPVQVQPQLLFQPQLQLQF